MWFVGNAGANPNQDPVQYNRESRSGELAFFPYSVGQLLLLFLSNSRKFGLGGNDWTVATFFVAKYRTKKSTEILSSQGLAYTTVVPRWHESL